MCAFGCGRLICPQVGSRISVFVRLLPPGAPAVPGAYDFQCHAWFARIGAVGYAFGLSRQLKPMVSDSKESWTVWIATLGQQLVERIRTAIPGTSGTVAAAFKTGGSSAIPKELVEAMRVSGLAHLLAICGLHMSLVAATLFFGLRAFLAMSELLALQYPIKKWAAAVALAGAFGYLLLTGATILTQRAFLMTGLVLLAVLLDRTAIALRLVAWAAAAILLVTPESLLSASFQMSFATVVVLVAVYEHGQRLVGDWAGGGWGRKIVPYLSGVGLTTLVAGLATGIFALYHFGRTAHFSLEVNLLVVPVTPFWIMPWGDCDGIDAVRAGSLGADPHGVGNRACNRDRQGRRRLAWRGEPCPRNAAHRICRGCNRWSLALPLATPLALCRNRTDHRRIGIRFAAFNTGFPCVLGWQLGRRPGRGWRTPAFHHPPLEANGQDMA